MNFFRFNIFESTQFLESLAKFEKFVFSTISSSTFLASSAFFSLSETPMTGMLDFFVIVLHVSETMLIFFKILFSLCCFSLLSYDHRNSGSPLGSC